VFVLTDGEEICELLVGRSWKRRWFGHVGLMPKVLIDGFLFGSDNSARLVTITFVALGLTDHKRAAMVETRGQAT
jgi:hypothetical protein